jgi:hypothetical protein
MLSKRVEVLFDPKQYEGLDREARRRGKSMGWLIREAVERQYLAPSRQERQEAVRWLTSQNFDLPSWEEAKEIIIREKIRGLDID